MRRIARSGGSVLRLLRDVAEVITKYHCQNKADKNAGEHDYGSEIHLLARETVRARESARVIGIINFFSSVCQSPSPLSARGSYRAILIYFILHYFY